jgi:hypothetical protein
MPVFKDDYHHPGNIVPLLLTATTTLISGGVCYHSSRQDMG